MTFVFASPYTWAKKWNKHHYAYWHDGVWRFECPANAPVGARSTSSPPGVYLVGTDAVDCCGRLARRCLRADADLQLHQKHATPLYLKFVPSV